MAKAQLTTKLGTRVTIEGTAEEVAELVTRIACEGGDSSSAAASVVAAKAPPRKKLPISPARLVSELIDSNFFATPKELNETRLALEEQGHFYPVTTLSPTLLRFVRKRQLRRIKENKRWVYVT